jgi:hypothetical protein
MRTGWSQQICTDCNCPVYGLQVSYFSFTLSEHRNLSVSVLPESPFKTAFGITVIAIIIDLRPCYNCRSNTYRTYTLLLSNGIWYTVFENTLQNMTFFHSVHQNTQLGRKLLSFSFILWTELPTSRRFDFRHSYEISIL